MVRSTPDPAKLLRPPIPQRLVGPPEQDLRPQLRPAVSVRRADRFRGYRLRSRRVRDSRRRAHPPQASPPQLVLRERGPCHLLRPLRVRPGRPPRGPCPLLRGLRGGRSFPRGRPLRPERRRPRLSEPRLLPRDPFHRAPRPPLQRHRSRSNRDHPCRPLQALNRAASFPRSRHGLEARSQELRLRSRLGRRSLRSRTPVDKPLQRSRCAPDQRGRPVRLSRRAREPRRRSRPAPLRRRAPSRRFMQLRRGRLPRRPAVRALRRNLRPLELRRRGRPHPFLHPRHPSLLRRLPRVRQLPFPSERRPRPRPSRRFPVRLGRLL